MGSHSSIQCDCMWFLRGSNDEISWNAKSLQICAILCCGTNCSVIVLLAPWISWMHSMWCTQCYNYNQSQRHIPVKYTPEKPVIYIVSIFFPSDNSPLTSTCSLWISCLMNHHDSSCPGYVTFGLLDEEYLPRPWSVVTSVLEKNDMEMCARGKTWYMTVDQCWLSISQWESQ